MAFHDAKQIEWKVGMDESRVLRIGTRGSSLAVQQTGTVVDRLKRQYPDWQFPVEVIKTKGDIATELPYGEGDQGFFVKELEEALLSNEIDMAVHSLKDVPTSLPPNLDLVAICRRTEARDALVSKSGLSLSELPEGALIGTGSLRRVSQIAAFRQDLRTCPIRGNVDTRLNKLESEGLDGIILAAAALMRMGMENRITEYLASDIMLAAPGQGALAIEARLGDTRVTDLTEFLDNIDTRLATSAERAFLRALGGGCHVPIAASARTTEGIVELQGLVATPDGSKLLKGLKSSANPEELGESLAEMLLKQGAAEILEKADVWLKKG